MDSSPLFNGLFSEPKRGRDIEKGLKDGMAFILNASQAIKRKAITAIPDYSRMVAAYATCGGAVFVAYGYTITLGQKLWLKQVQVWFTFENETVADWIDFWVRVGRSPVSNRQDVQNWEDVINFVGANNVPGRIRENDLTRQYCWKMCKYYEGYPLSFGIMVETAGEIETLEMYATFEISEG